MKREDRIKAQKRLRLRSDALRAQDKIEAARESQRRIRAELKSMSGRRRVS